MVLWYGMVLNTVGINLGKQNRLIWLNNGVIKITKVPSKGLKMIDLTYKLVRCKQSKLLR